VRAKRFLFMVVGAAAAAVGVGVSIAGLQFNRVTLNDPTASSVALATDIDAYKVLLEAQPSAAWRSYYEHFVTEKGLGHIAEGGVQVFRQSQAAGRIIELPNGTRAEQADRIALSARGNPLHRYSAEAVKVRVREGPHKGLEGWTSPDLVKHEGYPLP